MKEKGIKITLVFPDLPGWQKREVKTVPCIPSLGETIIANTKTADRTRPFQVTGLRSWTKTKWAFWKSHPVEVYLDNAQMPPLS